MKRNKPIFVENIDLSFFVKQICDYCRMVQSAVIPTIDCAHQQRIAVRIGEVNVVYHTKLLKYEYNVERSQ